MASHISVMATFPQSHGLRLTWMRNCSGERSRISPSLLGKDMGAKQQGHHPSWRTSLPANGGMRLTAIDSMAQPTYEWNLPSMYTFTWLGKLEKGWNLMRLQFW